MSIALLQRTVFSFSSSFSSSFLLLFLLLFFFFFFFFFPLIPLGSSFPSGSRHRADWIRSILVLVLAMPSSLH